MTQLYIYIFFFALQAPPTPKVSSNIKGTTEAGNKSKTVENNEETTKPMMTENIEKAGNKSAAIPDEALAFALEKLGDLVPLAKAMHSHCTPRQEKKVRLSMRISSRSPCF